MTEVLSYKNSAICSANQWTGFYMIGISVMNKLMFRPRSSSFVTKKTKVVEMDLTKQ